MGVEHLSEKEKQDIKKMQSILKFMRFGQIFNFSLLVFIFLLVIFTPFYFKRPDWLLESFRLMLSVGWFYLENIWISKNHLFPHR